MSSKNHKKIEPYVGRLIRLNAEVYWNESRVWEDVSQKTFLLVEVGPTKTQCAGQTRTFAYGRSQECPDVRPVLILTDSGLDWVRITLDDIEVISD